MKPVMIGLCVGFWLISCAVPMLAQQPATVSNSSSTVVVPPLISFSGVLTDSSGKPLTSVVGVTFALYKDAQGDVPLWLETQNVYPDKTGRYTVLLGSTTSTGLPADLFVAGEARWLGVQSQGQTEQRILLASAPYALKAADAQTLGGLPLSAFVLAAPPSANAISTASASQASQVPAQSTAQPMLTGTTPVTTAGGTVNTIPLFSSGSDIENSLITQTSTTGININGKLNLAPTGTATATKGYNSQTNNYTASAFNSNTGTAVNEKFLFQTEPVGNDTTTPSGSLHILFGSGSNAPVETGWKMASNGIITFAPGQTFPGTGSGSVTSIASGLGLTGGPITTTGTLAIDPTVVPQLNVANVFTGNQSVVGSVSATQLASTASPGTPPLLVASATQVPNLNASYLSGYTASQFQAAGSYATLGANSFTATQTVAGGVNVAGNIIGTTGAGFLDFQPRGDWNNGIKWLDGSGNAQAHLFRYGWSSIGDNDLWVTNNGQADLTGVYLASGATSWTSSSDERLKTNIVPVTGILDKIKKIRVVAFDMASLSVDRSTGKPMVNRDVPSRKMKDGTVIRQQIGSIAQDWVADFPQLVVEPQTDDQYYGLDYDRIGVVALGGVKELTALVEAKDAEIKALNVRLAALEQALRQLTQKSEPVQ